jgi:hypothetical protein
MLFSMLGIVVTYKCNAMCDSCGPRCGPHRKEHLTVEEIKQIIDEASECGSKYICFTGGEPTLMGPRLEEVISHAVSKGNKAKVVTNAWWAKDPISARKRLEIFMDAGLTEISISADDWHLPYVPLERIAFAVQAARELDLRTIVAVGETLGSKITARFLHEYLPGNPRVYREGLDKRVKDKITIRPVNIVPFGFAAEKIRKEDIHSGSMANELEVAFAKKVGCPMVLESPAILPDGRVTGCCSIFSEDNESLVMGYWPRQSLREILEGGENDLLLNWIRLEGPYGIKDYIEKHAPEIEFKPGYSGICHLCGDILEREDTRRFLQEHLHEMRDHVLALKLKSASGLDLPIACIESRSLSIRDTPPHRAEDWNGPLTQIEPRAVPLAGGN